MNRHVEEKERDAKEGIPMMTKSSAQQVPPEGKTCSRETRGRFCWAGQCPLLSTPLGWVLLALWLLLGVWALVSASTARGAEPDAATLVARSIQAFYYAGEDMKARIHMELIDRQGRTRIRELTLLRWDEKDLGAQRYFIYFHQPGDVRRMTFLVWKYPDREDDRWIYIPAVDLVRRIAAEDKRSSFAGSDFTYEDVSGRDVGDDDHRLLREEDLGGRKTWVVESRPRDRVDYSRRLVWIDQETYLPLREEYYDLQGGRYKVFTAEEIREIRGKKGQAYPTVVRRTMTNEKTGHRTVVTYEDVQYDVGLRKHLFQERALRRPPRAWIR